MKAKKQIMKRPASRDAEALKKKWKAAEARAEAAESKNYDLETKLAKCDSWRKLAEDRWTQEQKRADDLETWMNNQRPFISGK